MDRYDIGDDVGSPLPNLLGLTDTQAVYEEEAVGFLRAEHSAVDALNADTSFTLEHLYRLHQDALGHVYSFAGNVRTANLSKGGFLFAPAHTLPQTLESFAQNYLERSIGTVSIQTSS
jgi:cell filamentation protein